MEQREDPIGPKDFLKISRLCAFFDLKQLRFSNTMENLHGKQCENHAYFARPTRV
jgi:hypothetical protein